MALTLIGLVHRGFDDKCSIVFLMTESLCQL